MQRILLWEQRLAAIRAGDSAPTKQDSVAVRLILAKQLHPAVGGPTGSILVTPYRSCLTVTLRRQMLGIDTLGGQVGTHSRGTPL